MMEDCKGEVFNNECWTREPKHYLVKNETYAFGHDIVWQAKCGTSEMEILQDNKDAKGYNKPVKDKNGVVMTRMGSGAMLGGLDKEVTFYPVIEGTCREVEGMEKEWDKFVFPSEEMIIEHADKKDLLREYYAAQKGCGKFEEKCLIEMDESAITAKFVCDIPQGFKCVPNIEAVDQKFAALPTDVEFLLKSRYKKQKPMEQPGLNKFLIPPEKTKRWMLKKEVGEIYGCGMMPFIFQMTNGDKIVVAPRLSQLAQDADSEEYESKRRIKLIADEMKDKIRDKFVERLGVLVTI